MTTFTLPTTSLLKIPSEQEDAATPVQTARSPRTPVKPPPNFAYFTMICSGGGLGVSINTGRHRLYCCKNIITEKIVVLKEIECTLNNKMEAITKREFFMYKQHLESCPEYFARYLNLYDSETEAVVTDFSLKTEAQHHSLEINIDDLEQGITTSLTPRRSLQLNEVYKRLYIEMEMYREGDLSSLIRQQGSAKCKDEVYQLMENGRFEEGVLLNYFEQLAKAVNYLAERNLMHRDVKDMNILVSDDRQKLLLTDFESLEEYQEGKVYSLDAGTSSTQAPELSSVEAEQISTTPRQRGTNGLYTPKVDVFSLGCVFMKMVTPGSTFERCLDASTIVAKMQSSYCTEEDIAKLITKMMRRNPEKRIDIGQVLEVIQRLKKKYSENCANKLEKVKDKLKKKLKSCVDEMEAKSLSNVFDCKHRYFDYANFLTADEHSPFENIVPFSEPAIFRPFSDPLLSKLRSVKEDKRFGSGILSPQGLPNSNNSSPASPARSMTIRLFITDTSASMTALTKAKMHLSKSVAATSNWTLQVGRWFLRFNSGSLVLPERCYTTPGRLVAVFDLSHDWKVPQFRTVSDILASAIVHWNCEQNYHFCTHNSYHFVMDLLERLKICQTRNFGDQLSSLQLFLDNTKNNHCEAKYIMPESVRERLLCPSNEKMFKNHQELDSFIRLLLDKYPDFKEEHPMDLKLLKAFDDAFAESHSSHGVGRPFQSTSP